MTTKPAAPPEIAGPVLAPGVAYFTLMVPSPIVGPQGQQQYGVMGPFLDMGAAATAGQQHPGALLAVTLILHQAAAPAAALRN